MGQILSHWRVVAATACAAVFIIGAFALARNVENPPAAQASAETELLQAFAQKDSDSDGLPDWEEALYGTDPRKTDSHQLGMTDGTAVSRGLIVPKAIADIAIATSTANAVIADPSLPPAPAEGTLTAAFARNFFTIFMDARAANGGNDLSEEQMNDVVARTLDSLASVIAGTPDYKAAKDLIVQGSGFEPMKEYAIQAEAVLNRNTGNASKNEISYLQDAIMKNDTEAYGHIAEISKLYRNSAVGISVLPVPAELASADLLLVNALMRLSGITADFARADLDPLAALLALKQYPDALITLRQAFIDIGNAYGAVNVTLPAGSPGAAFVTLFADLSKSAQKS